jgi:hypothetical protein
MVNEHLPYESDASQDLVEAAIGHCAEGSLVGPLLGKYRRSESAQPVGQQFARQTFRNEDAVKSIAGSTVLKDCSSSL